MKIPAPLLECSNHPCLISSAVNGLLYSPCIRPALLSTPFLVLALGSGLLELAANDKGWVDGNSVEI